MKTLALDNFGPGTSSAYINVRDMLIHIEVSDRGFDGIAAHLHDVVAYAEKLGDKPINTMVASLRSAVVGDVWYVANPTAAEQFLTAYRAKDKLAVRRSLFVEWVRDEQAAYTQLATQHAAANPPAEKPAKKRTKKPAATPTLDERIENGEAGDERTEKPAVVQQPIEVVTTEHVDGSATSAPVDAPVQTVSIAPPAGTQPRAKRTKPAAEPKPEKQPRDKYESMTLAQLLVEVQNVFGHGTTMTNESSLRYKLRRAQKQIAAGQQPKFSVSTPAAPSVRFNAETAAKLRAILVAVESSGGMSSGIAGQLVASIDEQLATKSEQKEAA